MYSHLKVGDKVLVVAGGVMFTPIIQEFVVASVSKDIVTVGTAQNNNNNFSTRRGFWIGGPQGDTSIMRLITKEELALASGKIFLGVQAFLEKSSE